MAATGESRDSSTTNITIKAPSLVNGRILLFTTLASFGAAYYGYTSAMVSSLIILPSFQSTFSLPPPGTNAHDSITSNVVSIIFIGTLLGAILSPPLTNRLGPRIALALASGTYLLGCVMQTFSSGSLTLLYVGRVIAGIGMGSSTTLSPLYISEISSPESRGLLVGIHEMGFQITSVVGFWMGYLVEKLLRGRIQYMVLVGGQLVPGFVLFIAALAILPESPRFLVSRGKIEEAREGLGYLRQMEISEDYITAELAEIVTCHQEKLAAEAAAGGRSHGYIALFKDKHIRNRVFLGCLMMLFFNLTGAVTLLSYLPSILKSLGIQGRSMALALTGVFAVIKCIVVTISSIWFVDRYGRRVLLAISGVGISAVMWYLGGYLMATDKKRDTTSAQEPNIGPAGYIALACIYIWGVFFCLSSQVPWIYCAEIFPNHHRSSGVSVTTTAQFAAEYLVTKASPYMLSSIKGGTFFFFAASTAVMVVWVLIWVPETKGRSLENMEAVFAITKRQSDAEGAGWGRKKREKAVVVAVVEKGLKM